MAHCCGFDIDSDEEFSVPKEPIGRKHPQIGPDYQVEIPECIGVIHGDLLSPRKPSTPTHYNIVIDENKLNKRVGVVTETRLDSDSTTAFVKNEAASAVADDKNDDIIIEKFVGGKLGETIKLGKPGMSTGFYQYALEQKKLKKET